MRRYILLATVTLLFTQSVGAAHSEKSEARAAFREAVRQYRGFVVPHCAPEDVEAYVHATAKRDQLFVQSLRKTKLLNDYNSAVADRAKQDANTRFECMQPPPLSAMASNQPFARKKPEDTRAKHFAEGDRQFAVMLRLRDAAFGSLDH